MPLIYLGFCQCVLSVLNFWDKVHLVSIQSLKYLDHVLLWTMVHCKYTHIFSLSFVHFLKLQFKCTKCLSKLKTQCIFMLSWVWKVAAYLHSEILHKQDHIQNTWSGTESFSTRSAFHEVPCPRSDGDTLATASDMCIQHLWQASDECSDQWLPNAIWTEIVLTEPGNITQVHTCDWKSEWMPL